MKKLAIALATASTLIASANSVAGTSTGTILVNAVVVSSCIVTAVPLVFGNYDGTAATDTTASTPVTLVCAGTSTATLTLNNGENFTSSRRMKNAAVLDAGSEFLSYGLFKPTSATPLAACAYTTPWGATTNGFAVAGIGLTAAVFNVCGSIPKGQNVSFGAYTDTVVVTATF